MELTEEEINTILKDIYSGKITPESLPQNLYLSISEKLKSGLYKGWNSSLKQTVEEFGYGSAPANLLNDLRENIYIFAGAKTFQQTEEMRGQLVKDGKVVTFDEFNKTARETFDRYNKTWIESEYITAIGQGETARRWADIERDKAIFPFLRYVAVMDANTSTICAPFNDVILPVDNPFWSKYSPLNHYRCRCVLEQLEDDAKESPKAKVEEAVNKVSAQMDDSFKINPGIKGEVFGKGHPYYNVPDEYKDLAKDNFNLPIPKAGIFEPAKTAQEIEARILKSGVEKVNLKGLSLDMQNSVLEAVETEHKLSPLKLSNIKVVNRESKARADYDFNTKEIRIFSKNVVNREYTPLKTWDEQAEILKARRKELVDNYIGNAKYDQNSVYSNIRKYDSALRSIEREQTAGRPPRYWSTSSMEKTNEDALRTTMIHEIGHHRDDQIRALQGKRILDYNFIPNNSPTEYGATKKVEYFTEWFVTYRKNGPDGIPPDLLKLFELIK